MKRTFLVLTKKKLNLTTEAQVEEILKNKDDKFNVKNVMKKERNEILLPFTTSSLQQEAARKLNFRAKKTMMLAQQLYEGIDLGKEGTVGLITYMRTDSTRISETAKAEAYEYIERIWKGIFQKEKRKEKKQMKTQDAHEAIRPTSIMRTQ